MLVDHYARDQRSRRSRGRLFVLGANLGMYIARALSLALLVGLLPTADLCAQDDEALDVQAWFIAYGDLWWEPTAKEMAAVKEHYHLPYYLLIESGPQRMDEAALDRFLDNVLKAEDWRGSRILRMTVSLLNSSSARIEAEWQDFADSGAARGPCFAYEYAVASFNGAWKILTATQRPCPIEEG